MTIEVSSNDFTRVHLGKEVTITKGDLKIVSDDSYRIRINVLWDKEWVEFLTECAKQNHLTWMAHDYGHRSSWQIVIDCDQSTIMWIGYWFNQWKANK